MKISKLALIALLGGALMAFGCDSSSDGGSAGSGGDGAGGDGGAGGEGGVGGAPGVDDPCEESESCIFCPADSLDPLLATFLPDGLTAPITFTAAPTAAPVAGADVTIEIDAETFIEGLSVAVSLSVTEGGTTTYVATGSADTAEIDIPLQTVMGAANEDLVIQLGAGSGDFLVDVDATELVVTLDEALVNMAITSPLPLNLTLDATADGPCELSGPGVTIPVPAPTN
jgi:hypothetical protein